MVISGEVDLHGRPEGVGAQRLEESVGLGAADARAMGMRADEVVHGRLELVAAGDTEDKRITCKCTEQTHTRTSILLLRSGNH